MSASRVSWLAKLTAWDRDSSSIAWSKESGERVVEHALRHRQSERRALGEAAGPIVHEPVELIGGHHPVDQAERSSIRYVDDVGEEGELFRSVKADQAWEQPRRAEVDRETALGEDLREPGRLRRRPPGRSRGPCSSPRPRQCRRPWRSSAWKCGEGEAPRRRALASGPETDRRVCPRRSMARRGRLPSRTQPPAPVRTITRS